MNSRNQPIIDEFHANGGKVSGPFDNIPLLLLTSIGAKSGQPRVMPLAYVTDNDRIIIVASKGGAPTNPDWYYNIVANPLVTVEIGSENFQAQATIAAEEERQRLYAQMVEKNPGFADYAKKTSRLIPVIILEKTA